MTTLFDPIRFGNLSAQNRIVMAPLTRNRAGPQQVPTPLMALYYGQRSSAGLIISEATQISPEAQGYLDTPGIYATAQLAAWRAVTAAVHSKGGAIVGQLWHVGRISHVSLQPHGQPPVSSTGRRADAKSFTIQGFEDVSQPRALRLDELPGIVALYRQAARNAIDAGFDGVEVHGANGYLLEQFLRDSINDRSDGYGSSKYDEKIKCHDHRSRHGGCGQSELQDRGAARSRADAGLSADGENGAFQPRAAEAQWRCTPLRPARRQRGLPAGRRSLSIDECGSEVTV
jgi:2,4-dienoyl-CoA reductase-like NADH-dependent reductase (Old Yellow Enzyme family)